MPSLKETLRTDLTAAIRGREATRTAALRMALAAVGTEEVAGSTARELSDDEVQRVLAREVKKRREAAQAFDDGGRTELAQRERDESAVLEAYLPAQLSDEELVALVRAAVAETGADGPRAMGGVMKVLQPRVAGRAEGGRVAAEVKRQLSAGT